MISTSTLRLVARAELALNLSKNVKGLEGFYAYFVAGLTAAERHLIDRWNRAVEAERKKLMKELAPSTSAPLSDLRASAVNS